MSLPYENATSGQRAIDDIQKVLRAFGCDKFGHYADFKEGEVVVQFEHRGRPVQVKASIKGYATAWLKHHPYKYRHNGPTQAQHERKAMDIGGIAVYSFLRDWIKGQTTAIEVGILSFDSAFLGQLVLPSGKTVMETLSTHPQFKSIGAPQE